MDNFSANLKEVNDLIEADPAFCRMVDANMEYDKELEIADLATHICAECKHYSAWHTTEGCIYKVDGLSCDYDETEIEFNGPAVLWCKHKSS